MVLSSSGQSLRAFSSSAIWRSSWAAAVTLSCIDMPATSPTSRRLFFNWSRAACNSSRLQALAASRAATTSRLRSCMKASVSSGSGQQSHLKPPILRISSMPLSKGKPSLVFITSWAWPWTWPPVSMYLSPRPIRWPISWLSAGFSVPSRPLSGGGRLLAVEHPVVGAAAGGDGGIGIGGLEDEGAVADFHLHPVLHLGAVVRHDLDLVEALAGGVGGLAHLDLHAELDGAAGHVAGVAVG